MYRSHEQPDARIVLQPIAGPAVLGNFALASALFVYGLWFAKVWGTEQDASAFFPFLLFFGGFGQLGAALWGYRARNAVVAALNGSWAAFFIGLSLIYLLGTTHTIDVPARGAHWGSLGQWLIYMSIVTGTTAIAVLARSFVGFVAQATLTTGTALAAAGSLSASSGLDAAGGWLFVAAAAILFYAGAALMLDAATGAHILPVGRRTPPAQPIAYDRGDPGVKVGQ
jgi:succinate-acetate transporter protein